MAEYVDATFYAQIEPEYRTWVDHNGNPIIATAKVARLTQRKPDRPIGGTVTVKLTIRIPKAAFLPLRPEAVVVVPESFTEANPIEVVAEDPAEGEEK